MHCLRNHPSMFLIPGCCCYCYYYYYTTASIACPVLEEKRMRIYYVFECLYCWITDSCRCSIYQIFARLFEFSTTSTTCLFEKKTTKNVKHCMMRIDYTKTHIRTWIKDYYLTSYLFKLNSIELIVL